MVKPPAKRGKPGNPGKYSDKLFERICNRMAEGRTLLDVCTDKDVPVAADTVRRWVVQNVDGCVEPFDRARDAGLDAMADGLIRITDDLLRSGLFITQELIAATRLKVDVVKWYLSKRNPKVYGDARLLGAGDGDPVYLIGMLVDARQRLADAAKPVINVTPSSD